MKRVETVLRRYFVQFEQNQLVVKELVQMGMKKASEKDEVLTDEDIEKIGFDVLEETIG